MGSIRKEQALFLIAVAFGAWMYSGLKPVKRYSPPRATEKKWKPVSGFKPITVTTTGPQNLRELFVEPSESRPLPPRDDLPFLPVSDLPVVLVPLEIGQHPSAYYGLRHAAFGTGGGGNGAGAKDAGAPSPKAPAAPQAAGAVVQDSPESRYDRLMMLDGFNKFWGLYLGKDEDRFRLASNKGPFPGITIKFQWINEKTGRTVKVRTLEGKDVGGLSLAKTLRNEVGMRLYSFRPTLTNIDEQRTFIDYLLSKARIEAWVYGAALERARAYKKFAKPDEEGILMIARVLRAMGDIEAEYRLFRDLDKHKTLKGSSFQMRGLGIVEAKLGLNRLAEAHLVKAVEISEPIDPRNYAALATFFLDRGRAAESVEPARKAVSFKTRRNPSVAAQIGFHQVLVRALLATGDLTEAEKQASRAVPAKLQPLADYQAACIAYAQQDHGAAETLFQQIYNTSGLPDALLGIALCQLGKGDLDAGQASLTKLIDEQPRLRHLGLVGIGFAMSAGQGSDALEKVDAAIVAYPNHPYLLYMRGRQRRLNGDLEGAVEPLKKALQLHDEFLEALAELTVTYHQLFKRNGDAESLISAIRYVDRLAYLDQKQGAKDVLFLEMQGKIHYEARDLRGAREAFERGKESSLFCVIGLAMVEYAQKRLDLARFRLERMIRDLKPGNSFRGHAEHLLQLMVRHGNKEQVVDKFDRKELGKAWAIAVAGKVSPHIDTRLQMLRMTGEMGRTGFALANRAMVGPGRFLELRVDMKVGNKNLSNFAGVAIEIPSRTAGSSRFRLRVGMDDRGKVILELKDGRKAIEPLRTTIVVTRDEWHTIVVSVQDADNADMKNNSRFLKVFYDGQPLHNPQKPIKLNGLRRSATKSTMFNTELRVEGNPRFEVDVVFDNYRRIQERMK
jgi:tetratricopeptide (TPR) repeat protein